MGVEIWKGVCNASFLGVDSQDTYVSAYRDKGKVVIHQAGDFIEDEADVVMDESEAIDIALCILRELAPGFYQALDEKQ